VIKGREMGKEEKVCAAPVSVMLKNTKTGEEKEFILRPYREGDEEGMMACIRAEYGGSYFKPYFYDESWIREHAKSDDYDFFVGEADGRIAGMEIFTYFSEIDDCVEPAPGVPTSLEPPFISGGVPPISLGGFPLGGVPFISPLGGPLFPPGPPCISLEVELPLVYLPSRNACALSAVVIAATSLSERALPSLSNQVQFSE
jgi:hypothetical protein